MAEEPQNVKNDPIEATAELEQGREPKTAENVQESEKKVANEADGQQESESSGNGKKRADENGTKAKSTRKRRRTYDDAPKEEPESEENEEKEPKDDENDDEDDEDDNLGGLDESNIIAGGRRTRGKKIDYTKANEEVPFPDEDEEDDDEFEDRGEEEE